MIFVDKQLANLGRFWAFLFFMVISYFLMLFHVVFFHVDYLISGQPFCHRSIEFVRQTFSWMPLMPQMCFSQSPSSQLSISQFAIVAQFTISRFLGSHNCEIHNRHRSHIFLLRDFTFPMLFCHSQKVQGPIPKILQSDFNVVLSQLFIPDYNSKLFTYHNLHYFRKI